MLFTARDRGEELQSAGLKDKTRPTIGTQAIAALFLVIAWVNRRTARKLQSEIDLLG